MIKNRLNFVNNVIVKIWEKNFRKFISQERHIRILNIFIYFNLSFKWQNGDNCLLCSSIKFEWWKVFHASFKISDPDSVGVKMDFLQFIPFGLIWFNVRIGFWTKSRMKTVVFHTVKVIKKMNFEEIVSIFMGI